MKQRLHWALTITAFVVAVFGVTPLGSATVRTGVAAAKAPLYPSGVLARGPRGPRGPRGFRGRRGPKGPRGPAGDNGPAGGPGATIVAHARGVGAVTTSAYPGTADPLTGNSWLQPAAENDLVFASIPYHLPATCSTFSMSFLDVDIYLDGVATKSYSAYLPTPGSGVLTFEIPLKLAPGIASQHTLTAKLSDTCNTGVHYTVTGLELDIAGVA